MRALNAEGRAVLDENAQLFSNFEPIGTGWNAVAVLWNGSETTGWLAADNAVHHKPISKSMLDILALYAMTLGTLLVQKQTHIALQKTNQELHAANEEVQRSLKTLDFFYCEIIKNRFYTEGSCNHYLQYFNKVFPTS